MRRLSRAGEYPVTLARNLLTTPFSGAFDERVCFPAVKEGSVRRLAPFQEGGRRRASESVRCEVPRLCSHDLPAPRFMLTSYWNPAARSCSFLVKQRYPLRLAKRRVRLTCPPALLTGT